MEREKKRVYTIDDIANELGVSKTTVSRALSGKGRIGRQTREQVLAFAQQHGYQPNAQARGLAQRKTYNLGLMLPDDYTVIDFPFFKECMNGICETASAHNYDIVVSIMDSHNQAKGCRLVDNRKVDGIILSRSTVSNSSAQKYLKEKQMPFVVVGPSEDDGVVWVDNQNREGSRELTEVLLMKGFRRLALLGGSRTHLVTKSRLQGFLDAHYQYGMEAEQSLIFFDVDNYRKMVKAVEQILERKVDGIVCMDDFITSMLLGYIREKGIRVPEDLKLASMYDNRHLEMYKPTVTSIRFDTKDLGKKACITLLKLLGEKVDPEEEIPLNYQLILRESTK
ncbi:MAG: LacI family DNA-binding transcriptional regulator [Eubacteriales bacterium]|nr:LacI family DNA-binding transcriptional regulator [Eubacteriales bacterium]